MEDTLFHIALFSGFLWVILCDSHDYVLVRERKSWIKARDFCRKHYIDLANVQTDEEWMELNQFRLKSKTWIGLYEDVNWRWSFQDERLTYTRWDQNQPDNSGGEQDCVTLHSNGYWHDENCDRKCVVICQSDQRSVLVTDPVRSWKQAQSFCRENYTDLPTVKNESENQQLKTMIQNDSCAWIGLFRDSWKVSDQTNTDALQQSSDNQAQSYFVSELCAAVDKDGHITDELCSKELYFICKSPPRVRRQVLRLKVKAGDNVTDRVTADAVLKEVQKKLQQQGMAADVKFSWQEQLNGTVFQKLKQQHHRSRC